MTVNDESRARPDAPTVDELAVRQTFPFLLGAYLVINAVPDSALVVDGPDCVLPKAEYIHGNHDLHSTLLAADRAHRILHTNATVTTISLDRRAVIETTLRGALGRADLRALLLTALPMAAITDPPYELLLEELAAELGEDETSVESPALAFLRPGSLDGDWLDGYAEALLALARALPLQSREATSGERPRVAIIGHLMDRTEGDQRGNLVEFTRLVEGAGATLVSVWPGGLPTAALAAAGTADLIVSLPYGRAAARTVAARTRAQLVETALPMGLEGTSVWLRAVGRALAREEEVETFIATELRRVAPRLEWVVPMTFLDHRFGFAGDPHLMRGFIDMVTELGGQVPFRVIFARRHNAPEALFSCTFTEPHVIVDPRVGEPTVDLDGFCVRSGEAAGDGSALALDLIVGNSHGLEGLAPGRYGISALEIGFPSFHTHALYERPFLGYDGCLCLAERMAERMRMDELLAATGGGGR